LGHLVEKYNKAYFLKVDDHGNEVPYGVEGIEYFNKGELRSHDAEILERVNFSGANVLEFGFGRGESAKYVWSKSPKAYVGVDFSESACEIARKFLAKFNIVGPELICADAYQFAKSLATGTHAVFHGKIDVVLMLDFVEHIPRTELTLMLQALRPMLSNGALIVINTPDFAHDNDVLTDGLIESGRDSSDNLVETQGMHCNRYTLASLKSYFVGLDFLAISEGHYFQVPNFDAGAWRMEACYRNQWETAKNQGTRIVGDWVKENFEIAYEVPNPASLYKFENGNLKGLSILLTPSYLEYYGGGHYDSFLIDYIQKFDLAGKTIFDLGAYVGVNSMQFARLVGANGRVCAFEPNPINLNRLKLNLSENPDICDRVLTYGFGLSDVKADLEFNVHRNVDDGLSSASYFSGAHTTLQPAELTKLGFTTISAKVRTIDEFVSESGNVPYCLKIDIEGSEHLALRGAIETLKKHQPIILMELHSIFCALSCVDFLKPLGYDFDLLHVEPDGRCFVGAQVKVAPAALGNEDALRQEIGFKDFEITTLREANSRSANSIERLTETLRKEIGNSVALTNVKMQLTNIEKASSEALSRLAESTELNSRNAAMIFKQVEDISILQDETRRQRMNLELIESNLRISELRLNDCEHESLVLRNALLKYQLFPPIRALRFLVRKIRVLFGG
jgi:FkbM family methyltransferase